ncbi:MAG: DNA repair protein RecO [Candidatus Binatus sp.]|uniref:DNA repair protein RecO n=1 Tax=Candidatus Binatus sp. TaxID=2811406 RepID=UPI00271E8D30|nr:DNA repair protein RecO [Candidatus Binatus sp.]MDO8432932.1 DNA repair protein RecO [Candidatus Binatus sp.]
MPAEESTPAIVLRARDYADSDRIVTLLTLQFGKLSGIAKGAKSSRYRFERKLEPFSHVNLHFRRRPHGQLVFITRAEAADLAQHVLDDDLGKIALGSYMLELTEALTAEEGEAAEAYHILLGAMAALSVGVAQSSLRQAFEMRLMRWAGFGLEFARCRVCANVSLDDGAAVYFVVSRGGIVCARCRDRVPEGAIKVSAKSAAILARLGNLPIEDSPTAAATGPDGALALARFISSILDRRLRSQDFLDSILPLKS